MKTLTVTCCKCGRSETIKGRDADEIIIQLDDLGWGGKDDICPRCVQKMG